MILQDKDGRAIKMCGSCRNVRSIDDFYRNRTQSDGLSGYCKLCDSVGRADYARDYYERNRDRLRQYQRDRRARRRAT